MIHPFTPVALSHLTAAAAPQGSSPWASLLNTWWWYGPPSSSGPPPDPDDRYVAKFKWSNPLSFRDGAQGATCDLSKAWFPGHMLRRVDGKIVGQPFAPQKRPLPDVAPDTWGEAEE
jgi:hypothetical protein